jgi:uncharacterized protein (TIGR03435 family)
MNARSLAAAALLVVFSAPAFCQSPPTFEIADVHAAAYTRYPFTRPSTLVADRYSIKDATMVDLIADAWSVDAGNVQGGPAWLERDRYDILAKTQPNASKADMKRMLQALLADRFKLVMHTGAKPMPAYVLSVAKGGLKIKPAADESAPAHCEYTGKPPAPGEVAYITFTCRNTPMETFAEEVHQWAGGYLTNPVVDSTGLKGGYDFDIRWTGRNDLAKAGADGISIFDAVEKQLGLKLDLLTAPRTVILVDSVNEKPTPNPPGLDKALPPLPPREFEVVVVKPSKPGATQMSGSGVNLDRVDLQNVTLRDFMSFAFDLNPNDKTQPLNAPKWLDETRFDILAKVSSVANAKATMPDPDDLRRMVRDLLADRFQLKTHVEERPMEGYTLTSVAPKMKKADPAGRSGCKEGPGPDGKDPRAANPVLSRLLWCQNMSMPQFAEELQRIADGYIYDSVVDATGLEGSYDFSLSFSSAGIFNRPADPSGTASEPNGALSVFDAVNRQLGLKLEKQKRPMQVLVIDHVEEKPTEN